jgi:hypothetical protein
MDDDLEDLLAPAPPDPITRADWASLIHCPGWTKIVLPLLAEQISSHEQSVLTAHGKLKGKQLRTHLITQSALRDFLSLLDSRARLEFKSKLQVEDHIAENQIKRAFTLPATFQVAVHSASSTTDTPAPLDPSDFGQEPNPFAGAVQPRPRPVTPEPEPAPPPPPESPTP